MGFFVYICIMKRKPTGELQLFKEIWSEREHKCEVCESFIHEPSPSNFAHILAKGTYGKFRLLKDNIAILSASGGR